MLSSGTRMCHGMLEKRERLERDRALPKSTKQREHDNLAQQVISDKNRVRTSIITELGFTFNLIWIDRTS